MCCKRIGADAALFRHTGTQAGVLGPHRAKAVPQSQLGSRAAHSKALYSFERPRPMACRHCSRVVPRPPTAHPPDGLGPRAIPYTRIYTIFLLPPCPTAAQHHSVFSLLYNLRPGQNGNP